MAKTGKKDGKIVRPNDVLPRYQQGGTLYAARIDHASKGRSEGSGKKVKVKIKKPPVGGWDGAVENGKL